MAFFGVTVEKIASIKKHPNADKLDIATLDGLDFQFIVGKDTWKVGDTCLYFPIDAVLTNEIQEKLGIEGKLSKNTIKTIKLRGEISQGLICDLSLIKKIKLSNNKEKDSKKITKFLKVTKDDDDDKIQNKNWFINKYNYTKYIIRKLLFLTSKEKVDIPTSLPPKQYKYDIEGCDRYPNIISYMYNKDVVITEKIEGTQISYSIWNTRSTYKQSACSRNRTRNGIDDKYRIAAKNLGLKEFAEKLHKHFHQNIIVYGELCGPKIQKNIYNFENYEIFVFDISINNNFISYDLFLDLYHTYAPKTLKIAPILYVGKLCNFINNSSIKKLSDGKSKIANTNREGIVIKLKVEEYIEDFGRSIIKQRGPEYLIKSGS